MSRPPILVTQRLPSSVIATLEQGCDVDIHREAGAMPREELLARVRGKQGLICVLPTASTPSFSTRDAT